ncbi:mitochondrial 37S ribosomal protein rsm10 [Thecaphora frezii]
MAFRCSRLALQSVVRSSLSANGAGGSSSTAKVVREATRSLASSSRNAAAADSTSTAATSASPTLGQLRSALSASPSSSSSSNSSSSTPSSPASSAITTASEGCEEMFVVPTCLLPTESHPPTHKIHVATLHLRSYSDALQNLELFCDFARKAAFSLGIPVTGTAHLPTRTSLWTVPRSPFVHKKSQENFWRKTHSRAIKVFDANNEVVDRWLHFLRIHAMPGVGMKAELMRYHEIGVGSKLMEEAQALQRPSTTASTASAKSEAGGPNTAEQSADNVKRIADDIVVKEMQADTAQPTKPQPTEAQPQP